MKKKILKELVKGFSLEEVRLLETYDRQFKALSRLWEALKDERLFYELVITNALLSYQLQMKGEEYWERFADFFSKNKTVEGFEDFLREANRRFLDSRLKRLSKVLSCLSSLSASDYERFRKDLRELVSFLSGCMGQRADAKTVVFAAKMFIYAVRIRRGSEPGGQFGISIPVDSRIARISESKSFWSELEKETGIPQLRLDALLWIPMGMAEGELEGLPLELQEKLKALRKALPLPSSGKGKREG